MNWNRLNMFEMFFNYSKLWVISFFAKKVHYLPPKHASRRNSRNTIGRNPSMMIPLLANQDLTPMLRRWATSSTNLVCNSSFSFYRLPCWSSNPLPGKTLLISQVVHIAPCLQLQDYYIYLSQQLKRINFENILPASPWIDRVHTQYINKNSLTTPWLFPDFRNTHFFPDLQLTFLQK